MAKKNFPENYYKAEIMHLKAMEQGLKKKIKTNKEMIAFLRSRKDSGNEIRKIKQEQEQIPWLSYINRKVLEMLEKELKEIQKKNGKKSKTGKAKKARGNRSKKAKTGPVAKKSTKS